LIFVNDRKFKSGAIAGRRASNDYAADEAENVISARTEPIASTKALAIRRSMATLLGLTQLFRKPTPAKKTGIARKLLE